MKKIFLTTLLIGGLFISSCNDFLEVLPKDKQATDTYWESASDVESILGQGYSTMRLCVPKMLQWGELRGSSVTTTLTKGYMIQNFQVLPGNDFVKWMDFYKVINLANSVLENAPGVMDKDESYKLSQMNSHLTEAYFMRGLMYLYLVRNFQEVPLLTKAYIDDTMPNDVPKSSEKEIIDQIKEDVKAALATGAAKEMFEESWANKGRATKWALYALMAETCLWAEDYDECITYADYLINATSARRPVFMSIPTQWFQMFYPGNSNESIFEIQYNGAVYQQTTNSPCKIFTYSSGDESPEYRFSAPMTLRLDEEFQQKAARSYWGAYAGTKYLEYGKIWKYYGLGLDAEESVRTGNDLDANFIIYRMADVMLMKAEALVRKGGTDSWQAAIDLLNKIRKRSELPELTPNFSETSELEMLQLVLHERDMELAAEGKRWYDLVRLGKQQNYKYKADFISIVIENNKTVGSKWINSVLSNEHAWFLPIPEDDINTNKYLEQNPYYDVIK